MQQVTDGSVNFYWRVRESSVEAIWPRGWRYGWVKVLASRSPTKAGGAVTDIARTRVIDTLRKEEIKILL